MFIRRKSLLVWTMVLFLTGCSIKDTKDEKVKDLDFTVADIENVPQQIKEIIKKDKKEKFQTVFSDKENTYIVVGFGQQEHEDYSIKVTELYETKSSVVGSLLFTGGANKDDEAKDTVVYSETIDENCPYIIIQIEYTDKPVKIRNGFQDDIQNEE